MRMNQNERRFDFHGLGLALKRAREEKGWTQAYVAELVDRDSRTIMNIENKGQYPSFDLFVKLITINALRRGTGQVVDAAGRVHPADKARTVKGGGRAGAAPHKWLTLPLCGRRRSLFSAGGCNEQTVPCMCHPNIPSSPAFSHTDFYANPSSAKRPGRRTYQ